MNRSSFRALAILGATGLAALALAYVWTSSDRYASTTLNGYTLYNDVWGAGAGPQTIWANSGTNWA